MKNMNTNEYFTEKQSLSVLGISKSTFSKYKKGVARVPFGQTFLYDRKEVCNLALKFGVSESEIDRQLRHIGQDGISLEEWATFREVMRVFPHTRQQLSLLLHNPENRIKAIRFDGAWLYDKYRLKEYLLSENHLQRLVDSGKVADADQYVRTVNKW